MGKFYTMRKIRAQNGGADIGRIDIYKEIGSTQVWGDEETPALFIEDLNKLGTVSEIEIHIFSYGGDPFAALAIYANIKQRTEKISFYIDGLAASAATLILCAAGTVYMDETSMLMIHHPLQWLAFAGLNAKDARELADELDEISEPMIAAYMKKSGKTREEVIALMDGETGKGTWLTAAKAIEFGLADSYTPDSKKPLEVAAMIKPGVFNYRGNLIDLTSYDKAAEKTAGIINSYRGGNPMGIFNRKKKVAAKVNQKPKAEITFVEMVCPNCDGAVNLNPETGETFAGGAKQPDAQGGKEGDKPEATLARRMPSNTKAALYNVVCPHCGGEFVWDTDVNADGGEGQSTTDTTPLGGEAKPKAPAQTPAKPAPAPSATAAQAVCPECGAEVGYDTETAQTGTDDATGEEGYLLTCEACGAQFIEPYAAPEPTAIPAGANAQAAYRLGVLAERERILALEEMAVAAPCVEKMVNAAIRTGASVASISRNVFKALKNNPNAKAAQYIQALNRDGEASGVNNLHMPQHHDKKASFADSVFESLNNR